MFHSINPYTEELFLKTKALSNSELKQKLCQKNHWSLLPLQKRKNLVQNLIKALKKNQSKLSKLITQEMGKPLSQSLAEIEKCILLCQYACRYGDAFLADRKLPAAPKNSYITYQPMGAILGIMPWNFPCWQTFRFAIPALFSGNTVFIKPAPNVMGTGFLLDQIFLSAGFPEGVFQTLPISLQQTQNVIADPHIQGVSLTGSVSAGKAVAGQAGFFLKKHLLELGGSDPYIILDSADIHFAVRECIASRMNNNGQSCISAKRFIVTKKNAKKFTECVTAEMQKIKMGDPLKSTTQLGPLARKDLRDHLHAQVQMLIQKGAQCILGGFIPKKKGYFYPPTLVSISSQSLSSSFEDEWFGPAVLIITVKDEAEAIRVANHSTLGLGSAVFGSDVKHAENLAREHIQAGACAVNTSLRSHPALPFGGIKNSGYGRELSEFGFYEFVNIKTIHVNPEK